jgi:hypothetical protein
MSNKVRIGGTRPSSTVALRRTACSSSLHHRLARLMCFFCACAPAQEKKALEKLRKARRERGEVVTDDEDEA